MCWVKAEAVTPSDSTEVHFKSLYVGVSGDVVVEAKTASGTTANLTYTAVPAGGYVLVEGSKVLATGTTATNINRQW